MFPSCHQFVSASIICAKECGRTYLQVRMRELEHMPLRQGLLNFCVVCRGMNVSMFLLNLYQGSCDKQEGRYWWRVLGQQFAVGSVKASMSACQFCSAVDNHLAIAAKVVWRFGTFTQRCSGQEGSYACEWLVLCCIGPHVSGSQSPR